MTFSTLASSSAVECLVLDAIEKNTIIILERGPGSASSDMHRQHDPFGIARRRAAA